MGCKECGCKDGDRGAQGIQGLKGDKGDQGIQGPQGFPGLTGPQGLTGLQGPQGIQGIPGTAGSGGTVGPAGAPGAPGINGINGTDGVDGFSVLNGIVPPTTQGVDGDFYIDTATNTIYGPKAGGAWPVGVSLVGPAGPAGSVTYADFFALMPGDNAATVAVGAPVEFPQNGPTSAGGITRIDPTSFNILQTGDYRINFNVSVSEPGQLGVSVNGVLYAPSVVGRATGTSQITGDFIINITIPNSVIRVINPVGNPAALTITPIAGGTHSVSAHLIITALNI